MEKTYEPHALEQRWYQIWEEKGYFAPSNHGKPYCIMIPPPNVTGSLHMGHAFQDTLMDALIRYHRMKGDHTLWQAGTDHAGIATQMVVERLINTEGKTRRDYSREQFIEKVWEWKARSGGTITRQLRRMGASLDWSRERFTMDEGLSKTVREAFIRLYEEGLIYRGKRLVNWDTVLHTAVSDLEVLSEEENGSLWHMRYPLTNGTGHLVVATTRPETMLGDAAVAIHPNDERYKHLLGEFVELPLTGRRIPIIADDYVDPGFGTGIVKITPAHDFNDYGVWLRHRDMSAIRELPHGGLINIFTADAAIRANNEGEGELIPSKYIGLDRYQVRSLIVADLEAAGLLEKIEAHKLMVPRGDRSGSVIEPFLTDQWYVRTEPLAKPAIEAVEKGRVRFVPDNWKNTYFEWMRNIQEWCISRQIWWGHRIPAWYDDQGNLYVGQSEEDVRAKHNLPSEMTLKQDEDVLDTWFSSALWPFSTLGWPDDTEALKTFYPTSVLVTGFDIIFFWVARMIMMGIKLMGDVPFREVYIHGLVRDAEGQKMSKSKGNVLDPIDLIDGISLDDLVAKRTSGMMQPHLAERIEKATRQQFPAGIPSYGTDALRFTFASLASTGRDIRFDLGRTEGYRNFCNKLWNAARYVLMNTEGQDTGLGAAPCSYSLADRWIQSRLQRATQATVESLDSYRFDLAAQSIYEFLWNEYCDWYLELAKIALQNGDESSVRGTRQTLVRVLETVLRLAHPLMPFITEEIWQRVAPLAGIRGETIMLQPYPTANWELIDEDATAGMAWLMTFTLGVRRIRGEMNIAPGKPLPVLLQNGSDQDRRLLEQNRLYLGKLARLSSIQWLDAESNAPDDFAGSEIGRAERAQRVGQTDAPHHNFAGSKVGRAERAQRVGHRDVPHQCAIALVGAMKVLIPMAGLIDKEAELARLEKEILKLEKELSRIESKLKTPSFLERAPQEVVAKGKNKLAEMLSSLSNLEEQAEKIRAL